MVYSPRFALKINQMYPNVAKYKHLYMDPMGLERQVPPLLGSQLSVPVALAVVEVTSTSA